MTVTDSIGRHLLRKLADAREAASGRSRQPVVALGRDDLKAALSDARSGGSTAFNRLSSMLIGIDRAGDPELGRLAVSALVGAEPALWRNLDLATRRTWWVMPEWTSAARERITTGEPSPLALVVASFHPTGFVREAAVARLGEIDDHVALPALSLRTGDWVPEVRDRARAALVRQMSSVQALLGVGPLAVLLVGRAQGDWLFAQLQVSIAALTDSDLSQLLGASDWRLRRLAYSIALRDERLGSSELLRAAEGDADLVIRVQCADAAIRLAVGDNAVEDVRLLTVNGTAAVRAAAVFALARAGLDDVAEAAIADRNPRVREVAQISLRRMGVDPAERYRALVLATGTADPSAIAGLGETGNAIDADLIRPSLSHARPKGRLEAVRALRRLGLADVPTLLDMLDDQSAAVTRQVARSLGPYASQISEARLALLLEPWQSPHVRTAAFRLLRAQGTWTRLRTDLELYEDDDEALRSRARSDLLGWVAYEAATSYGMPSGRTADLLDERVSQVAVALGPDRERLLRFHLGLTQITDRRTNGTRAGGSPSA